MSADEKIVNAYDVATLATKKTACSFHRIPLPAETIAIYPPICIRSLWQIRMRFSELL
jgi:hypothetical protein